MKFLVVRVESKDKIQKAVIFPFLLNILDFKALNFESDYLPFVSSAPVQC